MKQNKTFARMVCNLALPVALQSMLQASFSIVDQIMIGQLGSVSIAGVGLAGKFSSVFSVMISAIGAVAGIMISQYLGQQNKREVNRSFRINLLFALGLALIFVLACVLFPKQIMRLYTNDYDTVQAAADYLRILAGSFLPMAGATLLVTLLRCMERAVLPLYASIIAAVLNTGLNYLLIFGKEGFSPMGEEGAAIATVISQIANFVMVLALLIKDRKLLWNACGEKKQEKTQEKFLWGQYWNMLLPILVCEFVWSVGENIYAIIYGHLGTESCAAMTLTNPIQGLFIGALCGLSQAASVIVGKYLGNGEYDEAYSVSKKLLSYGFVGSVLLGILIIIMSPYYVRLYQVEESTKWITRQILIAYAIIAPFKVQNMILGGGILRSGGKTKYVMMVDTIGTWVFGVPLGLFAAFVCELPIPFVYFILSLEECVRYGISIYIFRKRSWMQKLK